MKIQTRSVEYEERTGWRRPSPRLTLFVPLLLAAGILTGGILCGVWSGLSNPELLRGLPGVQMEALASPLATALITLLVVAPLAWVLSSRVLDLLAFFLIQNALLIAGYYFLPVTAWRLGDAGPGILQAGPLVILINATGFAVLLTVMAATYFWDFARRLRLPALRAAPVEYDLRLKWFLRALGIATTFLLALPMVRTGVIPLLAENAALARAGNMDSDVQRALYNLGTGLLPFVTAGLTVLCVRKPLRIFGIDGLLAASATGVQLLSGNRFPLAIAAFAAMTLLTMEKRLARPVLVMAFVACMLAFTGMSGFTGLLRTDRDKLTSGSLLTNSMVTAFTGDNLIDVRDAAWVLSQWDFDPLLGKTYLGGLVAMMPSGLFPEKKEWHLGLTGVRIVGWDDSNHFGLRVTFFGESFLNFGLAGVLILAAILGMFFGHLLRAVHEASNKFPPCLHFNMKLAILMQMCMPLANTSDAFTFWALAGFLVLQWLVVDFTILWPAWVTNHPRHVPDRT